MTTPRSSNTARPGRVTILFARTLTVSLGSALSTNCFCCNVFSVSFILVWAMIYPRWCDREPDQTELAMEVSPPLDIIETQGHSSDSEAIHLSKEYAQQYPRLFRNMPEYLVCHLRSEPRSLLSPQCKRQMGPSSTYCIQNKRRSYIIYLYVNSPFPQSIACSWAAA